MIKSKTHLSAVMITFLIAIFALSLSSCVSLGGKKGGDSSKSVNMDDVKGQDRAIRILVTRATASFLKGSAKVMSAVGKKEEALKYEQAAVDLEKNPEDPQKIKDTLVIADEANKSLEEIKAENAKVSEEGKKDLKAGIVYVGAGGMLDISAGAQTAAFVTTLKDTIQVVQGNPTKYGMGALDTLKSSLDLMTFLASELPKQGSAISNTFTGLTKYATTNGVSVTKGDAEKEAAKMEKG